MSVLFYQRLNIRVISQYYFFHCDGTNLYRSDRRRVSQGGSITVCGGISLTKRIILLFIEPYAHAGVLVTDLYMYTCHCGLIFYFKVGKIDRYYDANSYSCHFVIPFANITKYYFNYSLNNILFT